jgi:NAD(P)-dependent dehydrogenase (short-subunit alcohol dehydrogenase family)
MSYLNKTAVITGAAKGIGSACAKLFYDNGANVVLLDVINNESDISDEKWFYQDCDVSNEEQVKQAMDETIKKFGTIDYLINNAGIVRYGTITETSLEDWNLVMRVNLTGMFLCTKYALPSMEKNKRGVIINVASVQAFVSQDRVAAYTASKSAILGLTRSIAIDYAPLIRCIAVCPGTIDTPMLRDAIKLSPDPEQVMQECIDMHILKRIGSPEEVAALISFLCSDSASFITGQAIRIDGGLGIKIEGSKKD